MSNFSNLSRYNSILSFLKRNSYPSIKQLVDKINADNECAISERTFHRYILELEELGIKITYNKSKNGYFIDNENSTNHLSSIFYMLEAQEKMTILLQNQKLISQNNQKIFFETTNTNAENEYLKTILNALNYNLTLKIYYKSFENIESKEFEVQPLALKQHKNRFYLITNRISDKRKITFALDRIKNLTSIESKFKAPNFDLDAYFEHTFGITHIDETPQKIVLRVFDTEINYIKTLPLHHSQNVIRENENYIDISIFIVPNYEFENHILGIGEKIKVLEPEDFKNKILERIKANLKHYL